MYRNRTIFPLLPHHPKSTMPHRRSKGRARARAQASKRDDSPPPKLPIFKFSGPDEFRARHESATTQEFRDHEKKVDEFNKEQGKFCAWVIMAPALEHPWRGFIVRVSLNQHAKIAPGIGQLCKLRFVNSEEETSSWYFCRRSSEIINMNESWSNLMELVVDVPDSDLEDLEECLIPLFDHSTASRALRPDFKNSVTVQLELEVSETTMLAELEALDRLTNGKAGKAGTDAFLFMMDFENPTKVVDLCESFPHLANLDNIPDARLREELKKAVDGFDEDQTKAMLGLRSLPEGLCFVPGGAGAGKTWWVLMVAILAQSGEANCQTLYLLDINKPADDAADRMNSMCRQLGMKTSVIRVAGWRVADNSPSNDDQDEEDDTLPKPLRKANFIEGFLRAREPFWPSNAVKAPTLDEKAWELYSAEPEKHVKITCALDKVLASQSSDDWEANTELLRKSLLHLYYQALRHADFIATTPVTAPRLAEIFKPDLVIFDECAHARELSTMISLAYFEPKAWFFSGDHRQTEPFVVSRSGEFRFQLRLSTMERAEKNGATPNQLLVNHRAFGGLERLASGLFYGGAMRSGKADDELIPHGLTDHPAWLKTLAKGEPLAIPRLLLEVDQEPGDLKRFGTSCWNSRHQEVVLEHVASLLENRTFLHTDDSWSPGTIMILSPYKESVIHYQRAVNKLLPKQSRRRVQVRTIDTAQGQEADVVFLDLVNDHPTSHVDDPKRLCVALTRARQAEVILMHWSMLTDRRRRFGFGTDDGDYGKMEPWRRSLKTVQDQCHSGEAGAVLFVKNPSPSPSPSDGGSDGGW